MPGRRSDGPWTRRPGIASVGPIPATEVRQSRAKRASVTCRQPKASRRARIGSVHRRSRSSQIPSKIGAALARSPAPLMSAPQVLARPSLPVLATRRPPLPSSRERRSAVLGFTRTATELASVPLLRSGTSWAVQGLPSGSPNCLRRSMARGHRIIHAAGFNHESIASGCYALTHRGLAHLGCPQTRCPCRPRRQGMLARQQSTGIQRQRMQQQRWRGCQSGASRQ